MPKAGEEFPFGAYAQLFGHVFYQCALFGEGQSYGLPLLVQQSGTAQLFEQFLGLGCTEHVGQMACLGFGLLLWSRLCFAMDIYRKSEVL